MVLALFIMFTAWAVVIAWTEHTKVGARFMDWLSYKVTGIDNDLNP